MDVDAWLAEARDAVARAAGLPPEQLDLSAEDARTVLDLARIAAHESGDRRNAPLLCYLVGRARGRATLADIAEAVRTTLP